MYYDEDMILDTLREIYKSGTRVELDYMISSLVPKSTQGTVVEVKRNGSIVVDWDNGLRVMTQPVLDKIHIVMG